MHLFNFLPQGFAWLFLLVIVLVSREVWLPCQSSSLPWSELPKVKSEHTHTERDTCAHTNSPLYSFLCTTDARLSLLPPPTHRYSLHSRPHNYTHHSHKHSHIHDARTLSCYHSIVCHLKRRLRFGERRGFHLAFSTRYSANLLVTQNLRPADSICFCCSFLLLI